ncbi:katanin p80 WD40 repeat-containing subunit B1 homolog KTN80.4-like, partial [Macadamia integrifolia]|uniref:katanin p80 WD40 repeat-containing subunit B1 homolog KTN80.4-like n=1 Tax=Macadamia integrifolia TaxID=60698 RepID=UPI001C502332
MTFNPDGRTLLCGLHESLKIFSWEPIRCHDAVDVGWSRLSDLNIHEGKLLGCSYNQSCVGVWVVDISRIEPYAIASAARSNSHPELKSTSIGNLSVLTDNSAKISTGRISAIHNSDTVVKETKTWGRLLVSQNSDPMKEAKNLSSTGSIPGTPQRVSLSSVPKTIVSSAVAAPSAATLKRSIAKSHSTSSHPVFNKSDVIPVIVPRNNVRVEQASDSKREIAAAGRTTPFFMQARVTDLRKLSNNRVDQERPNISAHSLSIYYKSTELNEVIDQNFLPAVEGLNPVITTAERDLKDARCLGPGKRGMSLSTEPSADDAQVHKVNREDCSFDIQKRGKAHSLVANWEERESSPYEGPTSSNSSETTSAVNVLFNTRGRPSSMEKETVSTSNEDAISDLMEQHDQFVGSM